MKQNRAYMMRVMWRLGSEIEEIMERYGATREEVDAALSVRNLVRRAPAPPLNTNPLFTVWQNPRTNSSQGCTST